MANMFYKAIRYTVYTLARSKSIRLISSFAVIALRHTLPSVLAASPLKKDNNWMGKLTIQWDTTRTNLFHRFDGSDKDYLVMWGKKHGKRGTEISLIEPNQCFFIRKCINSTLSKVCTRKIKCKTNCVQRSWRMKKRWRRSLKKIKLFHWNRSTE